MIQVFSIEDLVECEALPKDILEANPNIETFSKVTVPPNSLAFIQPHPYLGLRTHPQIRLTSQHSFSDPEYVASRLTPSNS